MLPWQPPTHTHLQTVQNSMYDFLQTISMNNNNKGLTLGKLLLSGSNEFPPWNLLKRKLTTQTLVICSLVARTFERIVSWDLQAERFTNLYSATCENTSSRLSISYFTVNYSVSTRHHVQLWRFSPIPSRHATQPASCCEGRHTRSSKPIGSPNSTSKGTRERHRRLLVTICPDKCRTLALLEKNTLGINTVIIGWALDITKGCYKLLLHFFRLQV